MTPATLALLRFREADVSLLPSDDVGNLGDLGVDTGLTLPPVVPAFTGFGRSFGNGAAVDGPDVVPGATLATRDVTVRAILSWDLTGQAALGQPGTIVARGKGTTAAELVSYGVELRVVNAGLRIGELRMWWQDTAGNVKTQLGGQFVAPSSAAFMMVTAVRHWVSSSQVEVRYYVGDQLIGDLVSVDGDIAGGTTGTFCVGVRYTAGAAGRFLVGVIDELQVVPLRLRDRVPNQMDQALAGAQAALAVPVLVEPTNDLEDAIPGRALAGLGRLSDEHAEQVRVVPGAFDLVMGGPADHAADRDYR